MKDQVNGGGMVFNVQPIPYIQPLSIHRQRLVIADVVDHEGEEFFRELVATIVIGTIRDHYRELKGVEVCPDQVVGTCFGG